VAETASARSRKLKVAGWRGHRAGQHVDVRLTAPDGYLAAGCCSLSSAPDEPPQITVARAPDGEVSPFLVELVEVGDTFKVREPVGGYFVWEPTDQPLLLVGGGSGIAPLRSM
jgi:ferredoxin-NADP reductase